MRILVVDDEIDTRNYLRMALEAESFVVDTAKDGTEGSYTARTNDYDLIILDQILPTKSGLEVCREIRESGKHTPILILSIKSEVVDKTNVLDSGADDYLTKPYSHKELLSRMRALLRRPHKIESTKFQAGNLTLDILSQEVTVNKEVVYLTRKEFGLLELLMRHKGQVVSRGMIMEHVWDMDGDPLSKTIETHVANLRKKIGDKNGKIIINVPGRGYKIN